MSFFSLLAWNVSGASSSYFHISVSTFVVVGMAHSMVIYFVSYYEIIFLNPLDFAFYLAIAKSVNSTSKCKYT